MLNFSIKARAFSLSLLTLALTLKRAIGGVFFSATSPHLALSLIHFFSKMLFSKVCESFVSILSILVLEIFDSVKALVLFS